MSADIIRNRRLQSASIKDLFLTAPKRAALAEFLEAGAVAFLNEKRDGFWNFRAKSAIALLISGAAVIEQGELRLTELGQILCAGEMVSGEHGVQLPNEQTSIPVR